jgi:high-affinity nickel-transport protein
MFALGIRHGFDPDHIAMIDNMAYQGLEFSRDVEQKVTRWIGTLFALGHGLTVTVIAVILGSLAGSFSIPSVITKILDWLPVALLILVGTRNLHDLLKNSSYKVVGWKTPFVPQRLKDSSHPLAIFGVGVIFALVFDTATQAAAWGYAASAHSNALMPLMVGLAFTAGMVITDTVDGWLMVRLLRQVSHQTEAITYRRIVGWIVVLLSYGMALYTIARRLSPTLEVSDTMATLAGAALVFGLLSVYLWIVYRPRSSNVLSQELGAKGSL